MFVVKGVKPMQPRFVIKELKTVTTTKEANRYLEKGWVLKAILQNPKEFIMARIEQEPTSNFY